MMAQKMLLKVLNLKQQMASFSSEYASFEKTPRA